MAGTSASRARNVGVISHSGVRARLPDERPGRADSDGLITEEIGLDDGVQVVTQLGLIVAA